MAMTEKVSPGGQAKGGGSQHWCTPPWIIQSVHSLWNDWVSLDPFSNPQSQTGARIQWYGPDVDGNDGFELSWAAVAHTVFFNPPWNRTGDAVRKAAKEWDEHYEPYGLEMIGVIPCSMNSRHWPLVERAPARCYFHRRPSFIENGKEKRGNPKDVAAVYWGGDPYGFAKEFSQWGRIHFGVIA